MGHHKKPDKKKPQADGQKPDMLHADERGGEGTQDTKTANEHDADKPKIVQQRWFRRAWHILIYHYKRTTGFERLTVLIALGGVLVAAWVAWIYNGQLNIMRR